MKLIKALSAIIISIFTLSAFAQPFQGLYLGAAGIYVFSSAELTMTNTNGFRFLVAHNRAENIGFLLGAGYNAFIKRFLIGAEVNGGYSGTSNSGLQLNVVISTDNIAPSYSAGGELHLGYLINPYVLFYGIVGIQGAQFNVNDTFNNVVTRFNEWSPGLALGIGFSAKLNKKLVLALLFRHINYSSFSRFDAPASATVKFNPTMNQVSLALNYCFS